MKRFLFVASAALLLLSCATNAHKAASDEEELIAPSIEDPTKVNEDIPFIENLNQKKEGEEEETYHGPKDFNYCKQLELLSQRYIDFNKYTYEFMWCGVLSVAIMFFIKGRSANDAIANGFNKGIAEAISSNFAHFGTQKDPSLSLE
jgi:hypothetical protein